MSLSDYESTLKSFIHDEDKLVTYKWLSKELEVHVNVAKDILKQFWEKYQSKSEIVATYLLIGQLKDGSIRVEVVMGSDLNAAKEKFVKIDCEHLYSVQKCLPELDLLAIAGDGDLRYSSIKCNEEFLRDEDEVDELRYVGNVSENQGKAGSSNKVATKVSDKPVSKQADTFKNKKVEKSDNKKDDSKEKEKEREKEKAKEKEKVEESKSEAKTVAPVKKVSPPTKTTGGKGSDKTSKKPLQSKQTGFKNLFGKVPSKPVATESKKVSSNDEKEKSSLKSADKNDDAIKEKEEKEKVQEKEKEKKVQEKENEKNNQDKDSKKQLSKDKSASKSDNKVDNKAKNKKSTSITNSKKRQRSQEKNTASKRKRIVTLDSSEDESEKSEEEEEPMEVEEEPPKPVRMRSPSPPAEKRENGKRMVRKTIDKTYKDEDGYLVTKRVHVYEAVEDDEDDCKITATKEPPAKKKQVDTKAKKQTTLMNFFKKS